MTVPRLGMLRVAVATAVLVIVACTKLVTTPPIDTGNPTPLVHFLLAPPLLCSDSALVYVEVDTGVAVTRVSITLTQHDTVIGTLVANDSARSGDVTGGDHLWTARLDSLSRPVRLRAGDVLLTARAYSAKGKASLPETTTCSYTGAHCGVTPRILASTHPDSLCTDGGVFTLTVDTLGPVTGVGLVLFGDTNHVAVVANDSGHGDDLVAGDHIWTARFPALGLPYIATSRTVTIIATAYTATGTPSAPDTLRVPFVNHSCSGSANGHPVILSHERPDTTCADAAPPLRLRLFAQNANVVTARFYQLGFLRSSMTMFDSGAVTIGADTGRVFVHSYAPADFPGVLAEGWTVLRLVVLNTALAESFIVFDSTFFQRSCIPLALHQTEVDTHLCGNRNSRMRVTARGATSVGMTFWQSGAPVFTLPAVDSGQIIIGAVSWDVWTVGLTPSSFPPALHSGRIAVQTVLHAAADSFTAMDSVTYDSVCPAAPVIQTLTLANPICGNNTSPVRALVSGATTVQILIEQPIGTVLGTWTLADSGQTLPDTTMHAWTGNLAGFPPSITDGPVTVRIRATGPVDVVELTAPRTYVTTCGFARREDGGGRR